jgi:hypothetical protein
MPPPPPGFRLKALIFNQFTERRSTEIHGAVFGPSAARRAKSFSPISAVRFGWRKAFRLSFGENPKINVLRLARLLKTQSCGVGPRSTPFISAQKGNFNMSQTYGFNQETEALEAEQFEWGGEMEWGGEAETFSEAEAGELANELLGVSNEAELDRFIGDLIKKAGNALGQVVRSPAGQAIGGLLKGAAKKALPLAGAALGGYFGGPLGAQIGGGLANAASDALGLEAEAMAGEDREFEGAQTFVKMAGDAVKSALTAPPGTNPAAAARDAVTAAVQKHAPRLLMGGTGMMGEPQSGRVGRWIRHGRNIIILNCAPVRA